MCNSKSVFVCVFTGEEALPIANAGKDIVVQPGKSVLLNGIESLALGKAHITEYHWTLLSGDTSVKMEVNSVITGEA